MNQPADDQTPRPMSEEEIDALFAGIGSGDAMPEAAPEAAAAESGSTISGQATDSNAAAQDAASESTEPPAEPTSGPLSQDAIDALLAAAEMPAPAPPAPQPTAPAEPATAASAPAPDPNPTTDSANAEAAAPAEPAPAAGGPLSQDAIDALLAEAGASAPEAPAPAAPDPISAEPVNSAAAAEAAPEAGSVDSADSAQASDGPMSQGSIDDLLAEMGLATVASEPPPPPEESAPAEEPAATEPDATVDADLSEPVADQAASEDSDHLGDGSAEESDHMSQASIDELLAGLGKPEPEPEAASAAANEPATGSLSSEDLAALAEEAAHEDSETDEAAITQDDINALLHQMENNQGGTKNGKGAVDLDSLMRAAAVEANGTTSGMGTMGVSLAPQGSGRQSAVLSKDEIRGARFILVVATCLLALSTIALGLVVASVNSLAQQLAENRQANTLQGDSFAADLEVVEEHLLDPDSARRELGVRLAERLRLSAEGRERQLLVTRLLADYYRDQGSYKLAAGEFATLVRYLGPLPDDPALLYEQASVLRDAGETADAFRVVSILLANETKYTDQLDLDPESAVAIAEVMREAWLLRGHLQAAMAQAVTGGVS